MIYLTVFGCVALFGLAVFLDRKHRTYTALITKLKTENAKLRDSVRTDEVKQLDGVFETHITVDPRGNFVGLLDYVRQHEREKGFKLVLAASIVGNNQYMLSHFSRAEDDAIAVANAKRIAEQLAKSGVEVVRVKVEGHGAKGTPITQADYYGFAEYIDKKYAGEAKRPYFEFHVKIAGKHGKPTNAKELERDVAEYKGVAISYNLCSPTKKPLLTIRIYGTGSIGAQEYKDQVMNGMKKIGYVFEDKIQQEFSVYDSNPRLDNGWISA